MPLLSEHLDWVTLSIDSASSLTLLELGRAVQGTRVIPADRYLELGQAVRGAGMRLKLNTVVTSANVAEDMSGFVATLAPERWKIMRVLPVQGQNSGKVEPFLCSADEFEAFVQRHYHLETDGIRIVPEDNDDMRGSYAMVDPAGRFYDNVSGGYRYTRPILEVGVDAAWSQVAFYMDRFVARGGVYNFAA